MNANTDDGNKCIGTFEINEDSDEYIPYLDRIEGKAVAVTDGERELIRILMMIKSNCEESYKMGCSVMELIDKMVSKAPDKSTFVDSILNMILLEYVY